MNQVLSNFNTTIVRFKLVLAARPVFVASTFQYYNSTIQTKGIAVADNDTSLFQYYNSTIQTFLKSRIKFLLQGFQYYNSTIQTLLFFLF